MKTLDEHDQERRKYHRINRLAEPEPNGIACPDCGAELVDTNPTITLMSLPPRKYVSCQCGFQSTRIA